VKVLEDDYTLRYCHSVLGGQKSCLLLEHSCVRDRVSSESR
jgi:hypothetical protein